MSAPEAAAEPAGAVVDRDEPRSTGIRPAVANQSLARGRVGPSRSHGTNQHYVHRPIVRPAPATARGNEDTRLAAVLAHSIVSRIGNTPESPDQPNGSPDRRVFLARCLARRTSDLQQWLNYPQFPQLYPHAERAPADDQARMLGSARRKLWITGTFPAAGTNRCPGRQRTIPHAIAGGRIAIEVWADRRGAMLR